MGNDTVRNRQEVPAEDPLAELARLMGQEDEFADLLRQSDRVRRPAPAPQAAAAPRPPVSREPMAPPSASQPAAPRPAAPRPPEAGRPAAGSFAALAAEVYSEGTHRPAAPQPRPPAEGREHDPHSGRSEAPSSRPGTHEPRPAEARAPYVPPRPQPTEPARRSPPTAPSAPAEPVARAPLNPAAPARPVPPRQDAPPTENLRETHRPETARPDDARQEAPRAPVRPQSPPDPDFDFGLESRLPSWMARGGAAGHPDQSAGQPRAPTPAPARPAARAQAPARQFDLDEDAYDYGRSAVEDGDAGSYEVDEIGAEEPVRHGRRRLMVVGGLMAACIVVVAGVYVIFSGSGGSSGPAGEPPVIRADQGPNKVTPSQPAQEQAASGDGQKLIYDRVGGSPTTGNEQVVSSEEQPVDVSQAAQPQQPRVISTAPPTSSAPASNSAEPKRVRTLTVRADGTVVPDDAGPAPTPMAPTALPASGQSAASAPIPLNTGTGAPVSTNPTPLSATPSIVDNVSNPAASPAASRVAAAPTPAPAAATPAPAASAPAPAGAFVVQIASVRSEAEAQSTWRSMQSKFAGVLANQPFSIRRADLGDRGVYYRAQVGSFSGREDAVRLCEALRAQGGDCMVQRN